MHGTPLDHREWDGVRALLPAGQQVVAPDLRGHGTAAGQGPAGSYGELVDDLLSVMDAHGIERAHMVGHSFGGQVAQRFAAAWPERLARLTIVCSRGAPFPPFADAAARIEQGEITAVGEAAIARWFTTAQIEAGDPGVAYARSCLAATPASTFAVALRMIAGYSGMGELQTLAVPSRWVAAELDVVGTPEHMRECSELTPDGTFRLLPGVGHMCTVAQPELVAAALAD